MTGTPQVAPLRPGVELNQLCINTIRTLSIDAVEQASTFGWERYVGTSGHVIGMKTFGASAPLKEQQRKFGFEPDQVVAAARDLLDRG